MYFMHLELFLAASILTAPLGELVQERLTSEHGTISMVNHQKADEAAKDWTLVVQEMNQSLHGVKRVLRPGKHAPGKHTVWQMSELADA